jgi:hypothetical protein
MRRLRAELQTGMVAGRRHDLPAPAVQAFVQRGHPESAFTIFDDAHQAGTGEIRHALETPVLPGRRPGLVISQPESAVAVLIEHEGVRSRPL